MAANISASNIREVASTYDLAFINALFILLRTAQFVDINNASYRAHALKFNEYFRVLLETNEILSIKIIDGHIFINERLAKFDADGLVRAREIIDNWYHLGIGGVVFNKNLEGGQIDRFVYLLASAGKNRQGLEAISQKLRELGIEGLTLLGIDKMENADQPEMDRKVFMRRQAQVSFFRAVSTVENIMTGITQNNMVNFDSARRSVHSLIDILMDDESALLELTSIRDFDEYTYAHCANVCVYSLTIGIKLGLSRINLSNLGFASLFHDIGKVRLPQDLIRKPDAFNEFDWIQMQKHPLWGAKTILRNMKFNENSARAARVALEHHINNDFTGYPALKNRRPANLYSKIVSITDTFDALSSGRVYIKNKIPTDEVLRKMMYQMTVKFDAFLLKLFVNIVGVYPPGTLVLLSSDELAVVSKNNPGNLSRPEVRIVGDPSGLFMHYSDCDLSHPDYSAKYVKKVVDPEKYDINLRNLILAE